MGSQSLIRERPILFWVGLLVVLLVSSGVVGGLSYAIYKQSSPQQYWFDQERVELNGAYLSRPEVERLIANGGIWCFQFDSQSGKCIQLQIFTGDQRLTFYGKDMVRGQEGIWALRLAYVIKSDGALCYRYGEGLAEVEFGGTTDADLPIADIGSDMYWLKGEALMDAARAIYNFNGEKCSYLRSVDRPDDDEVAFLMVSVDESVPTLAKVDWEFMRIQTRDKEAASQLLGLE